MTARVEPIKEDSAFLKAIDSGDGGTGEVGKATKAILQVRTGVKLPPGTIITVRFPVYNPQAPKSL